MTRKTFDMTIGLEKKTLNRTSAMQLIHFAIESLNECGDHCEADHLQFVVKSIETNLQLEERV